MRTIKFRGRKPNGEWLYGDLVQCDGQVVIIPADGYDSFDCYFVDPETVGQYTGLKDKNGKEIYEGDVHEYDGRHFAVKFGYYTDDDTHVEMYYGWYLDSNSLEEQGSLGVDSEKYVNIVGNVYENPELLQEVPHA